MSERLRLEHFWRCAECGSVIAIGSTGSLVDTPYCTFGHDKADMQKIEAEGYVEPKGAS